jgi:DNA polymerase-1
VLISTGDKDMAQLVDARITLINTMSGTRYDRDGVKAKFDVWPEQIIDYLALVGDSSDNIPGIDKVGPKTAAKWLASTDARRLIANAAEVPGKVGENLRAGLETLALSRQLATIRCDVELPPTWPTTLQPADVEALRALYTRLGCARFLLKALPAVTAARQARRPHWLAGRRPEVDERLQRQHPASAVPIQQQVRRGPQPRPEADAPVEARARRADYETITDEAALERWIARCRRPSCSRSTPRPPASTTCRPRSSACRFCIEPARRPTCRWRTLPRRADQLDARADVLARLKPWLEDRAPRQARPSPEVRRARAAQPRHKRSPACATTPCSSPTCSNSVATRHDMDSVRASATSASTPSSTRTWPARAPADRFRPGGAVERHEYAAEDADVTLRLHAGAVAAIEAAEPKLRALYEDIEQPLVPVLLAMEAPWRAGRRGSCAAERRDRQACSGSRSRRTHAAGRPVQPRFAEAAAADPVREDAASRCCARRRPASLRPPRTCSRNWPKRTICRG